MYSACILVVCEIDLILCLQFEEVTKATVMEKEFIFIRLCVLREVRQSCDCHVIVT